MKITNTPKEIIVNILEFITMQDLAQTAQVCATWRDASKDQHLWQKITGFKFDDFVARCLQNSRGLFQVFCFLVAPAKEIAFCPFTKLYAMGNGQEDAMHRLMDLLRLVQVLPERALPDDLYLYNSNEVKCRGSVKEAVFAPQNDNNDDDEYVTTFVIQHAMQRHAISVSLRNPWQISYVEAAYNNSSTDEKTILLKTQNEMLKGEAKFVCWEKCGYGAVVCSDVFSVSNGGANNKTVSTAIMSGDALQWREVENFAAKNFEYWFPTNKVQMC